MKTVNRRGRVICTSETEGGDIKTSASGSGCNAQDSLGNEMVKDQVQGLTGRAFNRILGAGDSDTSTIDQSFGKSELERYLKEQLQFAKGEMFSGAKVSGAAKNILEELDQNGDGRVDWSEFQVFRSQMLDVLAPGVSEDASSTEISADAAETFSTVGNTNYSGIKAHAKSQIEPDTSHRTLIAQLGALLLLDSVDIDEQDMAPRDRSISETEWMGATREFSKGD